MPSTLPCQRCGSPRRSRRLSAGSSDQAPCSHPSSRAVRQHNVGFGSDDTEDTTSFNNDVASSSYKASTYLYTEDEGEHFFNLYNMVINDREYGTFSIAGDIQGPRFSCTADDGANCTFPT